MKEDERNPRQKPLDDEVQSYPSDKPASTTTNLVPTTSPLERIQTKEERGKENKEEEESKAKRGNKTDIPFLGGEIS